MLIGDMNINIKLDNAINKDYLDVLSENGFVSIINFNTKLPDGKITHV